MTQSLTPRVFVSAVSSDLRSARKVVNDALTRIECLPVEESVFGTEYGEIREMISRKIKSCQAGMALPGVIVSTVGAQRGDARARGMWCGGDGRRISRRNGEVGLVV